MYQHPFPYEIIYSNRKTLAIQITADNHVRVRAPRRMPRAEIESFLTEKEHWVLTHLHDTPQTSANASSTPAYAPLTDSERRRYIRLAREIFTRQVRFYADQMHVTYGRISIREQKNALGKLQQHRKFKLQLEADFCSSGSSRLCRCPRAGAPQRNEPFRRILRHR